MKKYLILFFVIVLFLTIFTSLHTESTISWSDSYDEAIEEAKILEQNIFVYFTAPSWCIWCQKMDKETLNKLKVQSLINDGFVAVRILDEINGKPNPEINRFEFDGFPTIQIHSSKGELLQEINGFKDSETLLNLLRPYAEGKTSDWVPSFDG
jgi:thioredoxin-related protein